MSQQPTVVDLPGFPELDLIDYECIDCSTTFRAAARAHAKRCVECRKKVRRERALHGMRRLRSSQKLDTESREGLKQARLFCGHTALFRHRPKVGEMNYCRQCQDWYENLGSPEKAVCSAGKHSMTKYNTVISSSGKKYCQECVYEDDSD